MGITFTESAASKLRGTIAAANGPAVSVRIAVVRTHCMGGRGFTYRLGLEDVTREEDQVVEVNGLRVCIDRISARYLEGTALDYVETLEGTGFKVENPNAIARCPCGHHDIFEESARPCDSSRTRT
ncbi:MAG: iron-sulfur cluster assembly accessory protein [Candidatus Rokubacteria bacterium]|nr:iron-sulfur cluster assembly accessory protein [Candidatus Rokubacteria bacterium]